MNIQGAIMKKKDKREIDIINILKETPDIPITTLAKKFSVSEMTIRRDLKGLEASNLLSRTRKLINLSQLEHVQEESPYTFSKEILRHSEEKDKIGKYAATLIEPNDILSLDAGTTTSSMSKYIPDAFPITIISNNFLVLQNVYRLKNVSVIFPGGYFHQEDGLFESTEGISLIRKHRATKLFLSAAGVHEKLGMTCGHSYEVASKQAMLESSLYKILLVDYSKFETINSAFFAPLEEMDMVITDSKIPEYWKQLILQLGIKLHIVD
jgi:DeoR family deoxyribose operon repressor